MAILVIAEHDNRQLRAAFYHVLSAACQIHQEIDVLVVGHQCAAVAAQVARLGAVNRVICVDDQSFCHQPEEAVGCLIGHRARHYSHILCSTSSFGRALMPRVAAKFGVAELNQVVAVGEDDTYVLSYYGGSVHARIRSLDPVKIISVAADAFEVWEQARRPEGEQAAIVSWPLYVIPCRNTAEFVGECEHSPGSVYGLKPLFSFSDSNRSNGRPFEFNTLPFTRDLFDTDPDVTDSGDAGEDMRHGGTGRIQWSATYSARDLCIALGENNSDRDQQGRSRVLIAVNKDSRAPIFQVAHYGLVADPDEVMPRISEILS